MAQDSGFWNYDAGGDADTGVRWTSPYSAVSAGRAQWMSDMLASDQAVGYVMPGFGGELKVSENSPNAMSVIVASGLMFIRGQSYYNSANEIVSISAAHASNPRIDRIVAEITYGDAEIRLAVVEGTPAATPSVPALTQTLVTYQIPIAHVWIPAADTTVEDEEIDDQRLFAANFYGVQVSAVGENLIHNSEFMAFSDPTSSIPPDGWTRMSANSFAKTTKPSQMSRGSAVQITVAGAAPSGMFQTFPCKASTMYSFKFLVNVNAGDGGVIGVQTDSAAPATVFRNIRRTGSWLEVKIHFMTEADATVLSVYLMGMSLTDVVQYGQVICTEGYIPGPFRQCHELIMLDSEIGDAAWSTTAKSTGTTTLDFDVDFQTRIPVGVRAVVLRARGRDSGSAASGNCRMEIRDPRTGGMYIVVLEIELEGVPNDEWRSLQGLLAVDNGRQFSVDVVATGASTFDATLVIIGMQT